MDEIYDCFNDDYCKDNYNKKKFRLHRNYKSTIKNNKKIERSYKKMKKKYDDKEEKYDES